MCSDKPSRTRNEEKDPDKAEANRAKHDGRLRLCMQINKSERQLYRRGHLSDQKWKFKPARTISFVSGTSLRELMAAAGAGDGVKYCCELNSTWRYSSFAVQLPQSAVSTPTPAVQPVRVCVSAKLPTAAVAIVASTSAAAKP